MLERLHFVLGGCVQKVSHKQRTNCVEKYCSAYKLCYVAYEFPDT